MICIAVFFLAFGGIAMGNENRALILVDEEFAPGVNTDSQAALANLMGHFDMPYEIRIVDSYVRGDVDRYRVTFYLGSTWDRNLPAEFLNDVMITDSRMVWINYNLWRLAWSDYQQQFETRYGFRFLRTSATGAFKKVLFKGRTLTRSQPDFADVSILNSGIAKTSAYISNGSTQQPYIVHSGNFWYVADDPLSQGAEDSAYLAFCEELHDMLDIEHATNHKALVRIEDIDPTEDPIRIRAIADYLNSENVPFSLAVIPRFTDPLGAWGTPQTIDLYEKPDLVSALNYAVSRGGTIIMHGYTHQYGVVANPTNGVTGVDSEFFIQKIDGSGNISDEGPVPEDSINWVQGRIDSGVGILSQAGFPRPFIWETPHYLASDLDNKVFSDNFRVVYQRNSDIYFPYVINKTVHGTTLLPENLGYIEPGVIKPQTLINRADKELVVRDGFASFFYHSEVDISYLKTAISGIKAKGFTFVDAKIAADAVAPVITINGPSGLLITDSATLDAAIFDAEYSSGINYDSLNVRVNGGAPLACTVVTDKVSCPIAVLEDGLYSFQISISDMAGNNGIATGQWLRDQMTPSTSDNAPADWQNSDITVALSCADATSACKETHFRIDGGDEQLGTSVAISGEGEHSITYHSIDNAGNIEADKTVQVRLDKSQPTISNIKPSGTVTDTSLIMEADLSDAGGAGIDTSRSSILLDGEVPGACDISFTHISCESTDIAFGSHIIAISVADNAGNIGSAESLITELTCTPSKPSLSITHQDEYWDGYADYLQRELSVMLVASNKGRNTGYGVTITGGTNSSGVTLSTGMPIALGDIAKGGSAFARIKYRIPVGVMGFSSSLAGNASDACGVGYEYQ